MTLYLMTNWDHPWPEEVEDDEDANSFWAGMDLWGRAIRSINAQSACNCCDLSITSAEVAAMVVETLDDNLMAIRWVCRRCGPTQEQARLMATALDACENVRSSTTRRKARGCGRSSSE